MPPPGHQVDVSKLFHSLLKFYFPYNCWINSYLLVTDHFCCHYYLYWFLASCIQNQSTCQLEPTFLLSPLLPFTFLFSSSLFSFSFIILSFFYLFYIFSLPWELVLFFSCSTFLLSFFFSSITLYTHCHISPSLYIFPHLPVTLLKQVDSTYALLIYQLFKWPCTSASIKYILSFCCNPLAFFDY